jgi:hypothetical protein
VQETLVEAITINFYLLPKSPLNIYSNKLIENLRLPMLINCDCKAVREAPEPTLLHMKLENRALSTRHLSLEFSANMTDLTARNLK